MLPLAADHRPQNGGDAVELRVYGPPILFAIARDSHCIFAGWNIDWLSVFKKAMPADRQVHVRMYRADGHQEKSVAVEPMAGTHYIRVEEPHSFYRLEIGYYQPADVWHSVAMSNEIVMPPDGFTETGDVDLVTIPFHLSFQQLVDLLGPGNETELATAISRFQKRALISKLGKRLSREQKRILRKLGVSLSEIETARRAFEKADGEKLARHTGALITFGPTSPARGFQGSWVSAGS